MQLTLRSDSSSGDCEQDEVLWIMLRILHVANAYLPYIGGSSLRLRNLLKPLVAADHCEFHILVPKRDLHGKDIYKSEVVDHEIIDGLYVHRVQKISNMVKEIRKICKEMNIDIIHAHNPRFALMSIFALVGRPLILETHAVTQMSLVKELLTKLTYKLCDRIIVLSNSMKQQVIRKYGVSSHKIQVIYNGVEIEKFTQPDKENFAKEKQHISERFVIGYVGTFYKWQGVEDLARSFSSVVKRRDDVRLLMVGEGPEFENVKNIIGELDIGNKVTLTGSVPPDEVPYYIGAMDIFIVPRPSTSETETAVPLKVLEAMAMGKPIVATNVGGLAEVIEDGVNGILTEPGNTGQLADKILSLVDNESLRREIGEKSKQKAKEFNWEHSSMKLLSLYNELSDSGAGVLVNKANEIRAILCRWLKE